MCLPNFKAGAHSPTICQICASSGPGLVEAPTLSNTCLFGWSDRVVGRVAQGTIEGALLAPLSALVNPGCPTLDSRLSTTPSPHPQSTPTGPLSHGLTDVMASDSPKGHCPKGTRPQQSERPAPCTLFATCETSTSDSRCCNPHTGPCIGAHWWRRGTTPT
jgi:hypothetical protein